MTQQDHVVSVASRSATLVDISDEAYAARQTAPPTDAEIAASAQITRRQLFEEIDDLLTVELQPAETWLPAVVEASGLDAATKAAALSAVNRSQLFDGASPLFLLVGAALTPSLDADEVHQLIIRASQR